MTPFACAHIIGNSEFPELSGYATFYENQEEGIWITVELTGLPDDSSPIRSQFFGMHIHENGDCTVPFDKTGNHYNPLNAIHPDHLGDLPPLLSSSGYAYILFYTNRLTTEDVIGRSIIIHLMRDDFTSQPSGNSGEKIGCGVINPC